MTLVRGHFLTTRLHVSQKYEMIFSIVECWKIKMLSFSHSLISLFDRGRRFFFFWLFFEELFFSKYRLSHSTLMMNQLISTRRIPAHSLLDFLICSHCSVILSICAACFAFAHHSASLLADVLKLTPTFQLLEATSVTMVYDITTWGTSKRKRRVVRIMCPKSDVIVTKRRSMMANLLL